MEHYEYRKVTDRIYLVIATYGKHHNVMQLLLGDRKAAMIDTGLGATGNLRQLVEEITDLPIVCFLTHMHPDHAGASCLFDEIFLNPADEIHCWWALSKEKRMFDLEDVFENEPELRKTAEREMADNSGFSYIPLHDGDTFDLGGITLMALDAAGHTEGSMVFYCPEENAFFCGDAIAPMIALGGEHREELTPFKKSFDDVMRIAELADEDSKFFCGHAPKTLGISILNDVVSNYEKVAFGPRNEELFMGKHFSCDIPGKMTHREVTGDSQLIYSEATLGELA